MSSDEEYGSDYDSEYDNIPITDEDSFCSSNKSSICEYMIKKLGITNIEIQVKVKVIFLSLIILNKRSTNRINYLLAAIFMVKYVVNVDPVSKEEFLTQIDPEIISKYKITKKTLNTAMNDIRMADIRESLYNELSIFDDVIDQCIRSIEFQCRPINRIDSILNHYKSVKDTYRDYFSAFKPETCALYVIYEYISIYNDTELQDTIKPLKDKGLIVSMITVKSLANTIPRSIIIPE